MGALGYLVGKTARNRVPYFEGLGTTDTGQLKALGAAMAASGAVALYHVRDVTPEALSGSDVLKRDAELMVVDDLAGGYAALSSRSAAGSGAENAQQPEIDLVWIGCPHASLGEMEEVVSLLGGRRVRSALWVTVARELRERARGQGLVAAIESCGGQVVADTCVVVAPVRDLGFRTMATPSAKGAYYGPSHAGLNVLYGTLRQCIEAAVEGRWTA
jgi:predicted aconitase